MVQVKHGTVALTILSKDAPTRSGTTETAESLTVRQRHLKRESGFDGIFIHSVREAVRQNVLQERPLLEPLVSNGPDLLDATEAGSEVWVCLGSDFREPNIRAGRIRTIQPSTMCAHVDSGVMRPRRFDRLACTDFDDSSRAVNMRRKSILKLENSSFSFFDRKSRGFFSKQDKAVVLTTTDGDPELQNVPSFW